MAKEAKEKVSAEKALEISMKNLKGFMRKASEVKEPTFLSTGHFYLDLAIGQGVSPDDTDFDLSKYDVNNLGGFPMGKMIELSGPEGSGKSSLAYRVVGYAQQKNMPCLWIDAEHSFSHALAEINGVDINALNVSDCLDHEDADHIYSAEEIFDRMCDAMAAGMKVVVLDSVANLTTKAELENYVSEGGVGMGALAQVLSKSLKKVITYADKYDCLVIIVNQIREKIGVMFGNPESTPGGRALKHLCSIRLKVQRQTGEKGQITNENDDGVNKVIGGNSYAYILKNRFGAPINGSIMIPIYYTKYFPNIEQIIFDAARALKIVKPRLGIFSWGDLKADGKTNFIQELKNKNLVYQLVDEIRQAAKESGYILPPEVVHFEAPQAIAVEKAVEDTADEVKVSRKRKTKDSAGESKRLVESSR